MMGALGAEQEIGSKRDRTNSMINANPVETNKIMDNFGLETQ